MIAAPLVNNGRHDRLLAVLAVEASDDVGVTCGWGEACLGQGYRCFLQFFDRGPECEELVVLIVQIQFRAQLLNQITKDFPEIAGNKGFFPRQ